MGLHNYDQICYINNKCSCNQNVPRTTCNISKTRKTEPPTLVCIQYCTKPLGVSKSKINCMHQNVPFTHYQLMDTLLLLLLLWI